MSGELKILENGDYELPDGRIIKADEVGKIYEKDRKEPQDGLRLEEGQCSGPIQLTTWPGTNQETSR